MFLSDIIKDKALVRPLVLSWTCAGDFNGVGASFSSGMTYPADDGGLKLLINSGLFTETFNGYTNIADYTNLQIDSTGVQLKRVLDYGTGSDGNISVSVSKNHQTQPIATGRTKADATSWSVLTLTSTTAVVNASIASDELVVGDEVLLINLQGTSSNYANLGKQETFRVASINDTTVTFARPKKNLYGDNNTDLNLGTARTNQRVILQRVPNYNNVDLNNGGSIYPASWDGTKGGVVFFRVAGTFNLYGGSIVTAKGTGYKGGIAPVTNNTIGQQGESIAGLGGTSTSANFGGGGGGTGVDGTKAGGGGGMANAGSNGNGVGGNSYTTYSLNDFTNRLLFGSGGGAGGKYDWTAGNGANGGGVVAVHAQAITYLGTITAAGDAAVGNPPNYGAGGGGAGGTLYLNFDTVSFAGSPALSAAAGSGAAGNNGVPSGAGSVGRLCIWYKTSITGSNPATPSPQTLQTTTISTLGQFTSTNVVNGHAVTNIKSFNYNLFAKPAGTDILVQYSNNDGTSWYDSSGTMNAQDALVTGVGDQTIGLSSLSQSTAHFTYRIKLTSDGTFTPTLKKAIVDYDPDAFAGSQQYWITPIIDAGIDSSIQMICMQARQDLDSTDHIPVRIQLLGSNTGAFAGEQTIYPNGSGTYWEQGGTYEIVNGVISNIRSWAITIFRYWRAKIFIDTGSGNTDTPIVRSFVLNGNILGKANNILSPIYGTTTSGGDLTVQSTTNATRGKIKLQDPVWFNDAVYGNPYSYEKFFVVDFTDGTANQKVDLLFADQSVNFGGLLEVSIYGGWGSSAYQGVVTRKMQFGCLAPGNVSEGTAVYTEVFGQTPTGYAISNITQNGASNKYRVQLVHRTSSGSRLGIRAKFTMMWGAPDLIKINNIAIGSVYTTDTTAFDAPVVGQ